MLNGKTAGAPFVIAKKETRIGPLRMLRDSEWDELIATMKDRRISRFYANGFATDEALQRIAELDHVTQIDLNGSRLITDDGLLQLARMPQLQHLDLSDFPGGKITDRGLEVLRHLPELRRFQMTWQKGITDAGVANLEYCEKIESVQLMGSPTGDGAIEALRGKQKLHRFESGKLVNHRRGLAMLHDFPLFKKAGTARRRMITMSRRAC